MLRRNVLIFHAGALGDFVLTWPFAVAMARIYPQSRVTYVTASEKGRLAQRVLRVEWRDAEAGWHVLHGSGELPEPSRAALVGAHAVYAFGSPDSTWVENVRRVTPEAKVVVIDPTPPAAFAGHVTEWVVEQLAAHPVERAATEQLLRSVAERGLGTVPPSAGDVVIHPGSGSPAKCWPVDRFVDLAGRLKAAGRVVRFVVGEVERGRWSSADLARLATAADVRHPATLLDLLGEVSTAGTFVGNDSGPGHLAGILGRPTVSLFAGPTVPARWRPLGPRVTVLTGDVAVDDAMAAIGCAT